MKNNTPNVPAHNKVIASPSNKAHAEQSVGIVTIKHMSDNQITDIDVWQKMWVEQDRNTFPDFSVFTTFIEKLQSHFYTDPDDAKDRLHAIAVSLMDAIATDKTSGESAAAKIWRIMQFCFFNNIGIKTSEYVDLQYSIAALAMYTALSSDTAHTSTNLANDRMESLNTQVNVLLGNGSNEHFQLTRTSPLRPSLQLAQQLFTPAWCSLMEPELISMKTTVQAIWCERPLLLLNQQPRQEDATNSTDVTLPDTECSI